MTHRRGTAIVEIKKGILLTAINKTFLLPGGRCKKGETRFLAAIRELKEETGLLAYDAKIIFNLESKSNRHTVVLIKAKGTARPRQEVNKIHYYNLGDSIRMSQGTKLILKKYYEWKVVHTKPSNQKI